MELASFIKRGNTWQYTVELGNDPVTGKRRRKSKGGFRTKKLAELAAAKIENKVHEGTFFEESDIVFNDFTNIWLKDYSKFVKPATIDTRKVAINLLNKYLKNAKIKNVTRRMYADILHDLHQSGKSDNTIRSTHSTASLIFKFAHRERYIKEDPTNNIDFRFLKIEGSKKIKDLVGESGNDEKFLEKEELATFLNIAKKQRPQDYYIFLTLAYTGLRRGELAVLKWSDIDFEEHTISITKTHYSDSKTTKDVSLVTPKTNESNRVIDVDPYVLNQLKRLKNWQNEYKMKNRKRYNDFNFIFINTHRYPGYPIWPHSIYDRMKSILSLMEHPVNLSPHSMRHTHASLCIEAGIPLRDIAERLGQRDTKMLEKIYAHTTKGQKEKTTKMFNELMNEVREKTPF